VKAFGVQRSAFNVQRLAFGVWRLAGAGANQGNNIITVVIYGLILQAANRSRLAEKLNSSCPAPASVNAER
jgi:hypothetical protein